MNCVYFVFVEICGLVGFDFVVIDLEYGFLNILVVEDFCCVVDCVGIVFVVRVSKNDFV